MKTLHSILIILLIAFSAFALPADSSNQQKPKTSGVEKQASKTQQQKQAADTKNEDQAKQLQNRNQELEGFVDLDGNGIDDRLEQQQMMGKQGKKGASKNKDRFIDLDGDGICDGRESGVGLRKANRNRQGKPPGR